MRQPLSDRRDMSDLNTPILLLATAHPDKAIEFYRDVLGLRLTSDEQWALVFDIGGVMLRIQKVDRVADAQYTVMGWAVADISQTVADLATRGVAFQQYPHLPQDEQGIWSTPDGAKIAWFHDPDGNTLSLTQHP